MIGGNTVEKGKKRKKEGRIENQIDFSVVRGVQFWMLQDKKLLGQWRAPDTWDVKGRKKGVCVGFGKKNRGGQCAGGDSGPSLTG